MPQPELIFPLRGKSYGAMTAKGPIDSAICPGLCGQKESLYALGSVATPDLERNCKRNRQDAGENNLLEPVRT